MVGASGDGDSIQKRPIITPTPSRATVSNQIWLQTRRKVLRALARQAATSAIVDQNPAGCAASAQ